MKKISFLIFLLLIGSHSNANRIDALQTNKDVEKFLGKSVNKKWKGYKFFNDSFSDTSKYGKNKFFKVDIDNNGLTDLILNGDHFFAVLDKGHKKYDWKIIDEGRSTLDKHTLTNIIYLDKTPLLLIKRYNEFTKAALLNAKTDTLILKYGEFIEYHSSESNFEVIEICLSTSGYSGPTFDLSIKSDRSAIYNAIKNNDKEGSFKAIIDTAAFNNIIRIINYINITSLKNNYNVGWEKERTESLEIKFKDGSSKKITDYGSIGSFGLENLYHNLYDLRDTQRWK